MLHTLVLALPLLAAEPKPAIRMAEAPGGARVVEVAVGKVTVDRLKAATPTAKQWAAILRVVVVGGTPAEAATRPPVAGTYSADGEVIRFEPQFPFVPGVNYQATFDPAKLPFGDPKPGSVSAALTIPKPPPGPPTSIAAVYPSAARLPENTLRFYVHFSGQMTHGDIYRHVKLLRDDGTEVPRPFLEIDEELWSTDGLRVTLLFHPGRVKKELALREELGPILEAGRRYTLVISREWKDADGRPLTAEVRKTFAAGPADDEPVTLDTWTLIPPRAGSDAPLIIRLAKPLDRALLDSMVWVTDAAGKKVEGQVTVGGGERVVTFAPARPWRRGDYKLAVDTRLEDVCGNRVGEPFEVDVFKPVRRKVETKTAERPFAVK